jgi:hypothetical protein
VKFYTASRREDKNATLAARSPVAASMISRNSADLGCSPTTDAPGTTSASTFRSLGRISRPKRIKEIPMKLTRVVFLALAVLLPASWTVAKAEDAPAADAPAKKEKKAKKSKKSAEPKDEKKAE